MSDSLVSPPACRAACDARYACRRRASDCSASSTTRSAFMSRSARAKLTADGMSTEDAYAEALRRFGDMDDLRDYCAIHRGDAHATDSSSANASTVFVQDVRFSLRQLVKSAGIHRGVAALTLALGIGATTAIFSVVDGVVLKPLPFPDPDRIVQLRERRREGQHHAQLRRSNIRRDRNAQPLVQPPSPRCMAAQVTVMNDGEATRLAACIRSRAQLLRRARRQARGRPLLRSARSYSSARRCRRSSATTTGSVSSTAAATALGARLTQRFVDDHDRRRAAAPTSSIPRGADIVPAARDIGEEHELHRAQLAACWRACEPGFRSRRRDRICRAILRRLKSEVGDYTWTVDGGMVSLRDAGRPARFGRSCFSLFGASGVLLLIACANVVESARRPNGDARERARGTRRARRGARPTRAAAVGRGVDARGDRLRRRTRARVRRRQAVVGAAAGLGAAPRASSASTGACSRSRWAFPRSRRWRSASSPRGAAPRGDLRAALSQSQRSQSGGVRELSRARRAGRRCSSR